MSAELSLDDINEAAAQAGPTDDQLKTVALLAARQLEQERAVEAAEKALKDAKAALQQTVTKDLPDAMRAVNMTSFKTADGLEVKIVDKVYANISEERSDAAHAWLRENGYGDLIKNLVVADFKAGEEELVDKLIELVVKEFPKTPLKRSESVHASTLKAWAAERLRELAEPVEPGEERKEFPEALFGVYRVNEAKVTLPKEPKVRGKR